MTAYDTEFGPEIMPPGTGSDPARRYWNPARETMPRERMRELQTLKLGEQLDYLWRHSAMYRKKFKQCGFQPGDLRGIEDLASLPFTTKAELRETQAEQPPFGAHQAAPLDQIVRITATSGTTGMPVFQGYTASDTQQRSESVARLLWSFGVRPGDRVVNGFAMSMFNAGMPVCAGVEHLGAINIPAGAERRVEGVLKLMQQLKATVWIGTPSFAAALSERAMEVLGVPAHELGLKILCGGGEPGFEQPAFRARMEAAWGTRGVYDWASSSDAHPNAFAQCEYREGKHHITPDFALIELIDPETGTSRPIEDGAEGEYLFTHLGRRACPLLRYRTGDVVRVRTAPCACGRTGFRIDIVGRADDMLIVRGVNVFPSALQAVIGRYAPKVGGPMQVVLPKPGPQVAPPLRILVESEAGDDALKQAIEREIRNDLMVTAAIEWVAPGALGRTEAKTRLIAIEPA